MSLSDVYDVLSVVISHEKANGADVEPELVALAKDVEEFASVSPTLSHKS